MAKRRKRSTGSHKAKSKTKTKSSTTTKAALAASIVAFTELEEEFFRAGESVEYLESVAATHDEVAEERPGLWRRLWSRATLAA